MVPVIQLGPWSVRCDPQATHTAHAALSAGGPEECGCCGCRNWIAQRPRVYTPDLVSLCEQLGIGLDKEQEVYECGRLPSGLYSYGGWWHFVGRMEEGPRWEVDSDFSRLFWTPPGSNHLRLLVHERAAYVPEAFAAHPVLQLDFVTQLPWVLDEPEPEPGS